MGIELPREQRTISKEDIAAIVGHLIECNRGLHPKDDIDHLGNRRVRAVGELIQNAFRIGLLRMERVVKERMTIQEIDKATPYALINIRPVVAAMREFFGGSQLSQFMDQTNPLAELTHKRRLVGARAGRPVPRARRLRRPRRPPQPLRPHLPDRDAGRTEHRPDRLARDVRPHQQLRLHRDAVPQGQADRVATTRPGSTSSRPGRTSCPRAASVVLKAGQPFSAAAVSRAQEAEGARLPDPAVRHRRDRLPAGRRGGAARRRPGERAARRGGPLHRPSAIPSRHGDTFPEARAEPGRLHGRLAQADRLGGDGADPVPGARRRQPRADGLEHAAPGRAAAQAGGAARRHRHGRAHRARLRPGPRRRAATAWSRA